MKKYLNQKQLAIFTVVLIALILVCAFTMCFSAPTTAFAYNDGEIYYAGIGTATKETETFSYATKTSESYLINASFPNYYNNNGALSNTCANVAGANIIGYYDRYYENLIPDVTPGISTTRYIYYPMTVDIVAKQAVINDLYIRMQTNVNADGSTQTQYKNGLSSYVQSKGLTATYTSVMTNGVFDLAKAKVQLQNGNPISLFMSGYNFTKVTDSGSVVTFEKNLYDTNHIAVVYGYEKVTYYDASGKALRTEIYLTTATGLHTVTGVYIVNKYGTLNDAESIHIS